MCWAICSKLSFLAALALNRVSDADGRLGCWAVCYLTVMSSSFLFLAQRIGGRTYVKGGERHCVGRMLGQRRQWKEFKGTKTAEDWILKLAAKVKQKDGCHS